MNSAIFDFLRPHYRSIKGYVSAGMEMAKTSDKIFLNANENPYELPGLEGLNRYPEPQPPALAEAYARAYEVEREQIMMTRGADEAINMLTKLFCEPASGEFHGDAVLICPPTFGMYGVNAKAMPARLEQAPLIEENGTFKLDADTIIAKATDHALGVKLVYLCTPNNPTGTAFDHAEIADIIKALEGHAVVILDETYAEFSAQGAFTPRIEEFPNLIILRTLSKSYGLAGMRMGCFICADTHFIQLAKTKAMDAYPLPRLSIEAAFHVLSPEISELAAESRQKLLAERARVIEAFGKSGHVQHIYPTDANFFLVKMKDAKGFYDFCAQNNVILRDFSTYEGTENCLRISIGTPEENDVLLGLLKKF